MTSVVVAVVPSQPLERPSSPRSTPKHDAPPAVRAAITVRAAECDGAAVDRKVARHADVDRKHDRALVKDQAVLLGEMHAER